ncbi:glycosyl hydrolase family 61-domain-containing protein [Colletotrichum godetiae]|uniref:lytic cellulose monooxygenase (C4-dehydrogenating) n=1 Tax=Colletotrichum godetiae TaxID=1209918 RepID=A0AAJ0ENT1_9PEZI|nr:glycosyl hydrolase family 61-domain-containing protein [Colletotrichum godetiae]KAK1660150.1 glycosyl hydrolase family 61-domain-containing protein [Colletotrichum godetiae]
MKSVAALALTASMANMVAGHAIFQQLWVNGVDQESSCVRMPASNSPVQDPTSNDMRCNANSAAATTTCGVKAGDTITVEMHQHNTRACTEEAIGGAHHGPVMVYLSSVADAATADGSSSFFKIFESGYFANNNTWGNDLINEGCGKQNVVIPSDIAPGDYLLRAETVALHAAGSENGAQYYMSCYQISVTGSGTAKPEGVVFPGAYKATDPGLLINIYNTITSYVIPGPALYEGGGSSGSAPASSAPAASAPAATSAAAASSSAPAAAAPTTLVTSAAPASATPTAAAPATTSSAAAASTSAAAAPAPSSPSGCKRRRSHKARRSAKY